MWKEPAFRRAITMIALPFATLLGACASLPPVEVRTWDTTTNVVYPERDDVQYRVPWLNESRTVGVVFSGGGTRAAAATLGQLRALDDLGWLPSVSHISAVSGGSWAAVPYTYLPPEVPDGQFLGPYYPPQELNDERLRQAPEKSLTRAIDRAWPFWRYFSHLIRLRGDESYTAGLGDIFLRPFGLGDRSKFFASHSEALQHTLDLNKEALSVSDFLLPQRGRPYLVVGATLIGKARPGARTDYFLTEMTPLYSGMVGRFPDPKDKSRVFGGGFVESLAFDSHLQLPPPQPQTKIAEIGRPRYRFTLSDVIGSSGAAPQAWLTRHTIDYIGMPEFRQWPIDASHSERETHFGDGGHVENIGLMPLLGRKITKILVFVNTATPFNACLDPIDDYPLYGDLIHFFRNPTKKVKKGTGEAAERAGAEFAAVKPEDESRIVIGSGEKRLRQLVEKFRIARENHRPLVYCGEYDIVENKRFSVRPYKASICWVYLDATKGWLGQLDQKNNPKLHKVVNSRRFPHYRTFFARRAELVRLGPEEVNALSNLTAWTVMTERQTIADAMGIRIQETGEWRPR